MRTRLWSFQTGILMSETALQRGPSPDPLRRARLSRSSLQVGAASYYAWGTETVVIG